MTDPHKHKHKQNENAYRWSSFLLLLHQLSRRLRERCVQWLLCRLLEPSLLQLHLLLQPASLYIRQQERLHQVPDQCLVVVEPPLVALQMLVHFLLAQVGHDACLSVRGAFQGVVDDPVEVTVDCALVHFDDFLVQALFTGADNLLGVSTTSFLNLSLASFILCLLDLFLNSLLFSVSEQFLWQLVKSLGDYFTLKAFVHGVLELFLMLLEQDLFGLVFGQVGNLGDNQQFLNQRKSLFLTFVHDVLLGPAS